MFKKYTYILLIIICTNLYAQKQHLRDSIVSLNDSISEKNLLEEVTVTSTRGSERLSQIPASVTVISSKQLQNMAKYTSNINRILELTVPGLGASTGTYANFGQKLRGRDMLVMVDGVPQSTPIRDGTLDLKTINAYDIGSVEVIKGATALYGVGGSGGFVNYITKDAEGSRKLSATTQVFGTANMAKASDSFGGGVFQSISGAGKRFSYYVSGGYEKTGTIYDAKGIPIFPIYSLGNSDIITSVAKVRYRLTEYQQIKFRYTLYRSAQESKFVAKDRVLKVFNKEGDYELTPGYGIAGTSPEKTPPGARTHNALLSYTLDKVFAETTRFNTDFYYQNVANTFSYSPSFVEGGGQSQIQSEKFGIRPGFNTNLFFRTIRLSLTYGVDALRDQTAQPLVDGRGWVPPITLLNMAPYVQVKVDLKEHWIFKIGARQDGMRLSLNDYSTLPTDSKGDGVFSKSVSVKGGQLNFNNTAFNAGIRYTKYKFFTPFVSYSQGFSLPDVGRVVRTATAKNIDEINIKAVTTDNYEFGFASRFAHVKFEGAIYYNKSQYGATLAFDEETRKFEVKRNPQSIYGADGLLDFNFWGNRLNFGATYSYIEGVKRLENGDRYLDGSIISPQKTTVYISVKPLPRLTIDLNAIFIGSRKRFDPVLDTKKNTWKYNLYELPVNGYTLVNLQASYDITDRLSISMAANNILNQYYLPASSQWGGVLAVRSPAGQGADTRLTMVYKF